MSPLVLQLFSARGVDRVWHPKRGGVCANPHHCSPRCWRHGCIWERLQDRPV